MRAVQLERLAENTLAKAQKIVSISATILEQNDIDCERVQFSLTTRRLWPWRGETTYQTAEIRKTEVGIDISIMSPQTTFSEGILIQQKGGEDPEITVALTNNGEKLSYFRRCRQGIFFKAPWMQEAVVPQNINISPVQARDLYVHDRRIDNYLDQIAKGVRAIAGRR